MSNFPVELVACCLCLEKHPPVRRIAYGVPTLVVPVLNYPIPWYLQFRGALCKEHCQAFNINSWTDHYGAWYELAGDHLRSCAKPAINPWPNDPSFKWEAFKIMPNFEPAPKEECFIQFWEPATLKAKGGRADLT